MKLWPLACGLVVCILPATSSAAADAAAPELGRLFFSAEHRAQLERQRLAHAVRARSLEGETLSIDGVVRRNGRTEAVWLNRQAHSATDAEQLGVVQAPDPARQGKALLRGADAPPSELKVGEALNRATGARDSRLGGGVIRAPGSDR